MILAGPLLKLLGKIFIVLLAVLGAYLCYKYFASEAPPEEFDHFREYVIDKAATELAHRLAAPSQKPRKLLFKRIVGDPTGRITFVLRRALEKSGGVEILEPEFTEDAQESVKDWFFSAVRKLVKPDEARALAERSHADAIFIADVAAFEDTVEETALRIDYELHDAATDMVDKGGVEAQLTKSAFSLTYLRLWMWSSSRWIRGLIWFLVAIFSPLVTYKLAWAVLGKERNDYNAMLVAGYTAIDTFLAWILLGFSLSGFFAFALFVLALFGSGTWNFLILDELEDMRH